MEEVGSSSKISGYHKLLNRFTYFTCIPSFIFFLGGRLLPCCGPGRKSRPLLQDQRNNLLPLLRAAALPGKPSPKLQLPIPVPSPSPSRLYRLRASLRWSGSSGPRYRGGWTGLFPLELSLMSSLRPTRLMLFGL